ncbi:MAG: FIST C-terminal domain-containing protein [Burkholderiales bacterium]|nr:FIST C-terminal domain-containing protein [Burkholderiales bacterium]
MARFRCGHATHPDWRMALALAGAQLDAGASGAPEPTLGFVYFTDAYVAHADELLQALQRRWPQVGWVGCVGIGVAASGVEYFDEPALVLMLAALPRGRFEVFSGARPIRRIEPYAALVHADPATQDLAELIAEMSDRTASGYLFGGVAASRAGSVHIADGVWRGGLSGVAFGADVPLVSRVTQGSQPIGPARVVTSAERNIVLALDGAPALPALLGDLGLPGLEDPRQALPKLRATLVGLSDANAAPLGRGGQFGTDTRVRHLVGLDPARQAIAVADRVESGMRLTFCQRDVAAARRDLVRICSEIREELAPETLPVAAGGDAAGGAREMLGAIYVSCSGRGGPHFGGPSAEAKIVRHALGDVPLAGFFAGGEIARHHLYGYTGVLTVFTGEG